MNSHNKFDANDPMDEYLRQGLKNWAAKQKTPLNARARLLLVASSVGQYPEALPYQQHQQRDVYLPVMPFAGRAFDPINHAWLWVQHLTLNPVRNLI